MVSLLLGFGGFLAYRSYDDARDRADKAEASARAAEARAIAREQAAKGQYVAGHSDGTKAALSIAGLDKPGWYVVSVERGSTPGVQPGDVDAVTEMVACKTYWFDPSDDSVWSRPEHNC